MEKVNIKFHNNGTVTFQHNKILKYVPEWSAGDKDSKLTVPNIPLLVCISENFKILIKKIENEFSKIILYLQTLTTQSTDLPRLVRMGMSFVLSQLDMKPFVNVTPEQLVFGYDDTLTNLANKFFPKHKRPNKKMGLLLGVSFSMS